MQCCPIEVVSAAGSGRCSRLTTNKQLLSCHESDCTLARALHSSSSLRELLLTRMLHYVSWQPTHVNRRVRGTRYTSVIAHLQANPKAVLKLPQMLVFFHH